LEVHPFAAAGVVFVDWPVAAEVAFAGVVFVDWPVAAEEDLLENVVRPVVASVAADYAAHIDSASEAFAVAHLVLVGEDID